MSSSSSLSTSLGIYAIKHELTSGQIEDLKIQTQYINNLPVQDRSLIIAYTEDSTKFWAKSDDIQASERQERIQKIIRNAPKIKNPITVYTMRNKRIYDFSPYKSGDFLKVSGVWSATYDNTYPLNDFNRELVNWFKPRGYNEECLASKLDSDMLKEFKKEILDDYFYDEKFGNIKETFKHYQKQYPNVVDNNIFNALDLLEPVSPLIEMNEIKDDLDSSEKKNAYILIRTKFLEIFLSCNIDFCCILKIKLNNGLYIENFSVYEDQKEVLIPPGSFKITGLHIENPTYYEKPLSLYDKHNVEQRILSNKSIAYEKRKRTKENREFTVRMMVVDCEQV